MYQLVILGYGNLSRGDDALGPLLIQDLQQCQKKYQWQHVTLLCEYQLQIENILDLNGVNLVVFIDANVSCTTPYYFQRCVADCDSSYSTHALSPAALLHIYKQVQHIDPPPSYVLNIRGEAFALGQSVSASAQVHFQAARKFLLQLCQICNHIDALDYAEHNRQEPQYA